MSIKNTIDLSKSPYKELINIYRVDVFNISDPFYNNRCFIFRINDTDIPLNVRRTRIFPNTSATCGTDCDLVSIDTNSTMECNCHNPSACASGDLVQDFETKVMQIYTTSNFEIMLCPVIINLKYLNI